MRRLNSWEDVWDVLNEAFVHLAENLHGQLPQLTWQVGHLETETFPFAGYISFSREGVRGQEDLVVSIGVQCGNGRLEWTVDLSLGDGEVLADGPSIDVQAGEPLHAWVVGPLQETLDFVPDSEMLAKEVLTG